MIFYPLSLLACLRDLKKAIRVNSTNNERTVLKALVEYNVIETDIVPLILSFQKDRNEVAFRFILACGKLVSACKNEFGF